MKRFLSFSISAILLASCSQAPVSPAPTYNGRPSASSSLSQVDPSSPPLAVATAVAPLGTGDLRSSSKGSSISSLSLLSSASSSLSTFHFPLSIPTLEVPFSPQAPFANWDPLHEETCEEMSLIMVHHYLEGTDLSPEQAEREIQDLVQWETEHGYPMDVTVAELRTIATQYYGHESRIVENPSIDDLKQLLADGFPVIVPAAGRMLGNPYFSGEGPWYHMLVLTGYGWWNFITNDPGTRRGERYEYGFSTLLNAIHDWTGVKEGIQKGRSAVLVLENKP